MNDQNWRYDEADGGTYLGHQRKKLQVADRRPVIRRAADLVGPGIAGNAIQLDNFNDPLATFNGYYFAPPGSANAPNPTDALIGVVVMDTEAGGYQQFRGMTSEITYTRYMRRAINDPSFYTWGPWRATSGLQAGRVGMSLNGASGSAVVVFEVPFLEVPSLTVGSNHNNWLPSYRNLSNTSFEAVFTHRVNTGIATPVFSWHAAAVTQN